jgi:hypothetical protein
MPAVFVTVVPHASVTLPHHDTDIAPPHVLSMFHLIVVPVTPVVVAVPLHPIYDMPLGIVSKSLGLFAPVRLKTLKLSYSAGPSFA